MLTKYSLAAVLIVGVALPCIAQETPQSTPIELEELKAYVGVWDAEIEVWAAGLDSPPTTFRGVETNRPYGDYWIASDFDSEFMGQTIRVHSIVGYDLGEKRMVGMVIDHGPYSARMTGDYDAESKTVHWLTEARDPTGKPMVQKTLVTQKDAVERVLVLMVPSGVNDEFIKFMQIRFTKRQ